MFNIIELHEKLRPYDRTTVESLGDVLQYAIPWSALVYVALTGNTGLAYSWLYSGLITIGVTFAGKLLFNPTPLGRRPNGGPYSFPSGHTSAAFYGAFFWLWTAGWAWAIFPLLLAAFTGYSRVFARKHYWRDVIAGFIVALGAVGGIML